MGHHIRSLSNQLPSSRSIYRQAEGNSGELGEVVSNIGGLRQGYKIRGRREAPEAMVAEKGGQEAAEC